MNMVGRAILVGGLLCCAACGPRQEPKAPDQAGRVKTSGKEQTALAAVPKEVLDAARSAQPTMSFTEAEAEVRDGRNYYDLGGRLPDGSEIELDLLQERNGWIVVETQRDIAFASAPEPVRAASLQADPTFAPARVIESRQNDGVVIYEVFGPPPTGGGDPRKIEIKFDGNKAELLTKEWAH
jgi:hypothetical protein